MKTARNFETKDGQLFDVQTSGKEGIVLFAINGEVYACHHTDAARFSECLRELAQTAKFEEENKH